MKISKIEVQKRNKERINIYIDEVFAFGLSLDVYLKYKLKKGQDIDDDFIENILMEEENNKAINSSLKYLSYRQRSIKEVRDQLKRKGYDDSIIENSIGILLEKNYLNDYEFAKSFIRDKSHLNKYGINKIKYDLMNKGVSMDVIEKTLDFDSDEEYYRALELANKKITSYKNLDKSNIYGKLGSFLQRKGYQYTTVSRVLRKVLNEE